MHVDASGPVASAIAGGWQWEPGVGLPLLASVAVYARGLQVLRARTARQVFGWRSAMFLCGCAVLALALLSPIDTLSSDLFTAHMLQHELLVAVAAPLLVAAEPGSTMLWALPQRARHRFGRFLRAPLVRATWRRTTNPPEAWLMHATAIWVWHVPSLFQAALANPAIHNVQHLTFFGSGLLYWWSVLHRGRRSAAGGSVISLFGTALQTALLGALLALSRAPWYTAYGDRAARWGMTLMEDQQFAGLLMWIPAGVIYLAAALYLFRRWLQPRSAPPRILREMNRLEPAATDDDLQHDPT